MINFNSKNLHRIDASIIESSQLIILPNLAEFSLSVMGLVRSEKYFCVYPLFESHDNGEEILSLYADISEISFIESEIEEFYKAKCTIYEIEMVKNPADKINSIDIICKNGNYFSRIQFIERKDSFELEEIGCRISNMPST